MEVLKFTAFETAIGITFPCGCPNPAPKPADKPGSVSLTLGQGGDHLSGTAVARRLMRPTRSSDGTGRPVPAEAGLTSAWPCSRWGLPGRPCHHGRRWSLTPPFHHHRDSQTFENARRPGCLLFCGPFPSGHPAWVLPSTVPYGARTFLTPFPGRDRLASLDASLMIACY